MNRLRPLLAAALLLLPPAVLTVVAQQAGRFSGRVTDALAGSPVSTATVTAHDLRGNIVATMTTDDTGQFTTPPLAAGPYYAKASAGPGYRDELYRELACVLGCDVRIGVRISVQSNLVAPGVDFTLDRADSATMQGSQQTPRSRDTAPAAPAEYGVSGNAASAGLPGMVRDTTSPSLMLPQLVTAVAVAPAGAPVAFSVTATDRTGSAATVRCQPASASIFPIGTTLVNCSAADARANAATGSFTVFVEPPSAGGRMRGAGLIAAGAQEHHVTFNIVKRGLRSADRSFDDDVVTKEEGQTRHDRFQATLVTHAYFFDAPGSVPGLQPPSGIDQAFFAGIGTWNGQAGFLFEAVVIDAGEPGRGADTITLTIRRAGGAVVAHVDGRLADGNIDSY